MLLARMARARHRSSSRKSRIHLLVLGGRLDNKIRGGEIARFGGPQRPRSGLLASGSSSLSTSGSGSRQCASYPSPEFLVHSHDHLEPAGRHLGDAVSHVPAPTTPKVFISIRSSSPFLSCYAWPLQVIVIPQAGARFASPFQSTREKRGTTPGLRYISICSTPWCPSLTFLPIRLTATPSGLGSSNSPLTLMLSPS